MKTPLFWYRHNQTSLSATLLWPLAKLYARIARSHRSSKEAQIVPLPVICLGNLVAGGSGKTPTAIALMHLLKDRKIFLTPGFLSRGYRGKVCLPERVDESHDPLMWGDEALLLNQHAPTFVARNRYQGALLMQQQGCDAVIMDDGLQHYTLSKDVCFALIDGMMGFGNGQVIPAGPLRQPLEEGLELVDAFILIGEDHHNVRSLLPQTKAIFTALLDTPGTFSLPKNVPYIAFCGIGFPQKFRATLEKNGAMIVGWHVFADHYHYDVKDIEALINEAEAKKARLITTEKDYARLPDFLKKSLIDVLPVEIKFDDPTGLANYIATKTKHKASI